MTLHSDLKNRLDEFIETIEFNKYYLEYEWERDNWKYGFPKILKLELEFKKARCENLLNRNHLLQIAEWGRLRNSRRIQCPPSFQICEDKDSLVESPSVSTILDILKALTANIKKGFGPTYLSKVVRFLFPLSAGAIDTRIVRVFGAGDIESKLHAWIDLKVRNDGYGWYIPGYHSEWPREYGKWLCIISYITEYLNDRKIDCSHPQPFIEHGLRFKNKWACADAEMALFAYASSKLNTK